jgi:MoaA/NifB/PqqE/SkfB family radical SAM enzyme
MVAPSKKLKRLFGHMATTAGRNELKRIAFSKVALAMIKVSPLFDYRVFGPPSLMGIETTNRCNLSCRMCARRYWSKSDNPYGDLSFDFFEKHILPHIRPLQTINLQAFGEPLIANDFFRIFERADPRGAALLSRQTASC